MLLYNIMMEVLHVMFHLLFGVIIGAFTERYSRHTHPYPRLRNIIGKTLIAYASVCFITGHNNILIHSSYNNYYGASQQFMSKLLLRISIFVGGIVIGTALQPVGLSGGIATGKSTVSSLLQQSSSDEENKVEFVVIDVDGIAHDILLPSYNDSVYDRLVNEFGTDILTEMTSDDKNTIPTIDRRKLGDLVFPNKQRRKKLNSITHPKIIKIMLKCILLEGLNLQRFWSKSNNAKLRVVCVDIPLLYEGGLPMRLLFGTVIVVACHAKLQLDRLHSRNPDLTLEQCRQRIASQIPVEVKASKAHLVIRNDESLKSLKIQVAQAKKEVTNLVAGSQRGIELHWLVITFTGLFLLRTSKEV